MPTLSAELADVERRIAAIQLERQRHDAWVYRQMLRGLVARRQELQVRLEAAKEAARR